ncbi:MAG: LysM peptidoglycan-binding domain-containing protein [Candidatus Saccharimonadales bacterium]
MAANVGILLAVAGFIFASSRGNSQADSLSSLASKVTLNPVDRPTSYDVAVDLASATGWSESLAVKNDADSARIQYAAVITGNDVTSKPQVVATALKSHKDIASYTALAGDTVSSIAQKFGVTSDSIRWSNDLSGDSLDAGTKLAVPPVNGIVYTVKSGDTPQSLASKFRASADQITASNDAEISGLKAGEQVLIPNGEIVRATPSYGYGYKGFSWGGLAAIYGGNRYDPGNCTWYAAGKRAAIGRPLPSNLGNASSWLSGAQMSGSGLSTGHTPEVGAVIWYNPPGPFYRSDGGPYLSGVSWAGHVGYVDSVDASGVHVSEMNVHGLYSMGFRTLSPSEATQYWYIY